MLLTRVVPPHLLGLAASAVAACVQHEAAVAAAARESKRGSGAIWPPKKEGVTFPVVIFGFDCLTGGNEPRPTSQQGAPDWPFTLTSGEEHDLRRPTPNSTQLSEWHCSREKKQDWRHVRLVKVVCWSGCEALRTSFTERRRTQHVGWHCC